MKLKYLISVSVVAVTASVSSFAQYRDVAKDTLTEAARADTSSYFPHTIPNLLPKDLFIPRQTFQGPTAWLSAPITRPVVHVMPVYGFSGYGFGRFYVDHWEKFFANLLVFNRINVPSLVDSQQMMVGNTIALGRKRRLYFYDIALILMGLAIFVIWPLLWNMGQYDRYGCEGRTYIPSERISYTDGLDTGISVGFCIFSCIICTAG